MTSPLTATTLSLLCVLEMAACRAKERPAATEGAAATERPPATSQQTQVTAPEVVAALEGAYGVHPGQRRNHTKGMCALGKFTGTANGSAYSRSPLFGGASVPVVARFSIAGGNPMVPDADRSPRGMALEFRLPDGGLQHMTMINTPMFFATMPRTFLDKMLALKPDPATGKPDPEAVKAFAVSHPDNTGQAKFLADNNPPPSYANTPYFGIHTFKFVNRNDDTTLVRWRFVPEDGDKHLTTPEMASMPRDFLEQALIMRTRQGPVHWDMLVTIGEPGDPQDNPTILWPKNRKELRVGTLTITSAMDQSGGDCKNVNYDPLVMSDGIAPTNDPVLLFRSPSYAVSFAKRLQGK
jgi:catalase